MRAIDPVMSSVNSASIRSLAVVLVTTALAALIHFGFVFPVLGTPSPVLLFVLAVVASASYGGLPAGLLATLVSVIIVGSITWTGWGGEWRADEILRLVVLAIGGVIASSLAAELRRARRRAEARQSALESEITSRQAAEKRLAASEGDFRGLAESLPDVVFAANAYGEITYVNRRWSDFAGVEEEPGAGWWARVHPDDAERAWQSWSLALATSSPFESRLRLRSQRDDYRWFLVRARPLPHSVSTVRWFGLIADIDAQMRVESALRDRDEQLRLALESTGLGIFEVEIWTERMTWSERCRAIWGFSEGEALTFRKVRASVHPADRRRAVRAMNTSRDPQGTGEFAFD
ncbi:MAG: PAS domain-containing protein, partial [Tepidisphaeraceae bacterium]